MVVETSSGFPFTPDLFPLPPLWVLGATSGTVTQQAQHDPPCPYTYRQTVWFRMRTLTHWHILCFRIPESTISYKLIGARAPLALRPPTAGPVTPTIQPRTNEQRSVPYFRGQAPKESSMSSKSSKRELIYVGGVPAYVRRNKRGQFTEVDLVRNSLPVDRRQPAKRVVPPGQGDRGDQRRRKGS
jgi:hypothetical protein